MVALYRVIVALRTQGALHTTNKKWLLVGGRYVKKASLSPIGRLRVVAQLPDLVGFKST